MNGNGPAVADLRTEFVEAPLGVESAAPLLSWRIESDRRGTRQIAYRVEVASSENALVSGRADFWDSGRVESSDSIGIRYAGAALVSRQRCFWRARIWDERDVESPVSAAAFWEMGLLSPSDWSAHWLAAENPDMRADREAGFGWARGLAAKDGETTKFRMRFVLPASADATLLIAANAKYGIYLDGAPLQLPPPVRPPLGLRPAAELHLPLTAGTHVVGIVMNPPSIGERFGFHGAELAFLLRARLADGRVLRFSNKGWKTALAADTNWQAPDFDDRAWDSAVITEKSHPHPWPKQSALLMRRAFKTPRALGQARLYATALGGYELHLNGKRVGDALLTPESTDFRKRALYRVYDVSDRIVTGDNVLGAIVGDGWYASATLAAGRYPWGPPPRRFLAQLELAYEDGSREIVATGPGWQSSDAPIIWSEIYDGECYDARLEQPGWSRPGFDASRWWQAQTAPAPNIALTAQIAPPIRRETNLAAQNITEPHPGAFVFDFGQNFAGWCRLNVKGPAGTRVRMRFSELLGSDGEVDTANLRSAEATDTYILRGDPAGETYEPHFTYHGFRYVELTGYPDKPTRDTLEGVVIHSDLRLTGTLHVDNPVIAQLWHNTIWSQRSNFTGIPTDCPQRDERLGWLGDANVFWDAACFNMDVAAFTRRFMDDVRDAQAENGAFSNFAPAAFVFPSSEGRIGAAPGWADAGVCMPWTVWRRYGDTAIVERNWDAMTRYLACVAEVNPDFLWRNGRGSDFGDWLALDAKNPGDPTTPKDLVGTATWAHSVACMAEMADAIGRAEEAQRYRITVAEIAAAFAENFVADDGTIGNDSQTGYILGLRYGLIPPSLRGAAVVRLVENIKRRGNLLTTGFLGTPNSLDVLADAGYVTLVYDLLLRTEFPSWGYMVAKGATTIWERWNGDTGDVSMNSFNHYALGAVSGFVFRRIAGIAPLEPGFRKFKFDPVLDPRVKRGGADYDSACGRVSTRWEQPAENRFRLKLTVPPNTTASVHLPALQTMNVTEDGRPLAGNSDITAVERTDGKVIVEVGTGAYAFSVG